MDTRRGNLWWFLSLVLVVLTLAMGFWAFTSIITGSDSDDIDNKMLTGTPNADIIKGCAGSDEINGDDGNDRIFGDGRPALCDSPDPSAEDGPDSIFGGLGNDYINGEGGSTNVGSGGDYIDGEDGRDRISGDGGDDEIHGDSGNDRLDGGEGDDSLYGEDDNDVLYGGLGNDLIDGGGGNDTLDGGEGTDHLMGGGGNDVFYLRPGQAGDGTEIVECTQNSGETSRVLLLRAGGMGFPRGTPSGSFTDTTVEIPDPSESGNGVFSIQTGPGTCRILRR